MLGKFICATVQFNSHILFILYISEVAIADKPNLDTDCVYNNIHFILLSLAVLEIPEGEYVCGA